MSSNIKLLIFSIIFGLFFTTIFYFTFGYKSVKFVKNVLGCSRKKDDSETSYKIARERTEACLDDVDAELLYSKVRVLCFIPTSQRNLATKAAAVKETWAWRCNTHVFFSSQADASFPTVALPNVREGIKNLPAKTMASLQYIYDHNYNDVDWIFKADDDTFAIIENLRYLLSHFNSTMPWYLGHHFKTHTENGYMSGGGGYVLSKAALKLLVEQGLQGPATCRQITSRAIAEDVAVGRCLETLGVPIALSLDAQGRQTFHPFNIATHLFGNFPDWYHEYSKHQIKKGRECCSELSITFHFVDPVNMHVMNQLLYNTRVYGLHHRTPPSLK